MTTSGHGSDFNAASTFLETIFGEGVPGQIAISTRRPGSLAPTTRFFRAISDAAGYASEQAKKEDVYYRVTTLKQEPKRGRGKDADSLALPGMHADIDVGPSRNNNRNYPPDEASALLVLHKMGIPLPMLVRSGGGLHPIWPLKEPYLLENPQDFVFAKAVIKAWNDHLNVQFGKSGWDVDPPGGLSKLLRPPGTYNHKTVNPRRVELLPGPIHRWPSIESLFEDAGLVVPEIASDVRDHAVAEPIHMRGLSPEAEQILLADPISRRLYEGKARADKTPSENDRWLLLRAGELGVDLQHNGFALMDGRRANTGEGWGRHDDLTDYTRRTVRGVREVLRDPLHISGPMLGGRWCYRPDVVAKVHELRDLLFDDGLNWTAFMVLEEMTRWSRDGFTTSVAQAVLADRLDRKKRTIGTAIRVLVATGWLLPLEEAKRGVAAEYALMLNPAFHRRHST